MGFRVRQTEDEFLSQVVAYAILHGWLVHHCRPLRTKDGRWRTGVQGHKGLPDLVLARKGRVVFAELKAENGKTTPEQDLWLAALAGGACEVYTWYPNDWPAIEKVLGDSA